MSKVCLEPLVFLDSRSDLEIDWLHLTRANVSLNSGDDIAGIVYSLGAKVKKTNEFQVGDRVAAFHCMMTPHGAFAEYAVAPQNTVFKIPEETSFEGLSTLLLKDYKH